MTSAHREERTLGENEEASQLSGASPRLSSGKGQPERRAGAKAQRGAMQTVGASRCKGEERQEGSMELLRVRSEKTSLARLFPGQHRAHSKGAALVMEERGGLTGRDGLETQ